MSVSLVNALPLQNVSDGFVLIGEYDNIVDFCEIDVSVNAEGNYSIQFDFSVDKITTISSSTQTFTYGAEPFFNYKLTPQCKYFKLTLTATTNIDNLTVQSIYKSNVSYKPGGTGADVNITNSFIPVSQYGEWNVNTQLTKFSTSIWDNAVIGAGDVSSNYANAKVLNNQSVSIYGHSSNATTLTILLSSGDNNFFYTQYTYTILEDSDFGFALVLPFKYLKLASSEATTISASVCWC
jgi:hypothetical protein